MGKKGRGVRWTRDQLREFQARKDTPPPVVGKIMGPGQAGPSDRSVIQIQDNRTRIMVDVLALSVAGRLPSWNTSHARLHWTDRARVTEAWRIRVLEALQAQGLDGVRMKWKAHSWVRGYHRPPLLDVDNLTDKLVHDGLTAAGVLVDDDPRFLGSSRTEVWPTRGQDVVKIVLTTVDPLDLLNAALGLLDVRVGPGGPTMTREALVAASMPFLDRPEVGMARDVEGGG